MNTRKIKILVIVAVAFSLALTSAYALFKTSLNIEGTAKGNADFKIGFSSAKSSDDNKATAQISTDATNLTINSSLSYPGDQATIDFVIKNTGTLSATVDNITITNNSNPDLIVEIVGLNSLQGTVLGVGEETAGSINVKWNQTSTVEHPTDVTFNATIDYSQTIK